MVEVGDQKLLELRRELSKWSHGFFSNSCTVLIFIFLGLSGYFNLKLLRSPLHQLCQGHQIIGVVEQIFPLSSSWIHTFYFMGIPMDSLHVRLHKPPFKYWLTEAALHTYPLLILIGRGTSFHYTVVCHLPLSTPHK